MRRERGRRGVLRCEGFRYKNYAVITVKVTDISTDYGPGRKQFERTAYERALLDIFTKRFYSDND